MAEPLANDPSQWTWPADVLARLKAKAAPAPEPTPMPVPTPQYEPTVDDYPGLYMG